MTEAEWLACDDPRKMLELLRGRVSERKLRLFAVACWRRNPYPVAPEVGPAIDLYEAYADGKATGDALRDAFARIEYPRTSAARCPRRRSRIRGRPPSLLSRPRRLLPAGLTRAAV